MLLLTDLREVLVDYWGRFLYLLPNIGFALLLLVVFLFISKRISALVGRRLAARSHDQLLSDFLTRFTRYSLLILGVVLMMQVLGMTGVVSGVVGAAGLTAFVVGFALKDIAENFLAGVVLAFNRPFRINDTVEIRNLSGHVEALNLRTTLIRTFDGKHIFLPNAVVLREPLINYTRDGHMRQDFLISVNCSPDPRPDKVRGIILEFVRQYPRVTTAEVRSPYVILEKASGTTADLRVYFWTDADDYKRGILELKSELMDDLRQHLQAVGYEQPAAVQ